MTGRTDLPRHVAVERLDLDDVGTIVAEHLRGIGPHQHGRHVDDLDPLQWSYGFVRSRSALACYSLGPRNCTALRRSRAADVWPYASQRRPGVEPGPITTNVHGYAGLGLQLAATIKFSG